MEQDHVDLEVAEDLDKVCDCILADCVDCQDCWKDRD